MCAKLGQYNYKRADLPLVRIMTLWHQGLSRREIASQVCKSLSTVAEFLRDVELTRTRKEASQIRTDRQTAMTRSLKCQYLNCYDEVYALNLCHLQLPSVLPAKEESMRRINSYDAPRHHRIAIPRRHA
jgi:hypothetical protein